MGNSLLSRSTLDFQALFQATPGLYLVLTPDLTIVEVSDAYLRATMTKREDIVGRGVFEVFPDNPDDSAATGERNLRSSLKRVLERRAPDAMPEQRYDIRKPEAEGGGFEERYWSPVNSPVLGPDNEVSYIIHSVQDVTEMVRLRQRGIEQEKVVEDLRGEERFRKAFNANPEPILIATFSDARFVDVNESFLRVTGYRREEVIGRTCLELRFLEGPDDHIRLVEMLTKRGSVRDLEIQFRSRSGERRTGLGSAEVIEVAGEKCLIAIIKDITGRKEAEAQMRLQAAALESAANAVVIADRSGKAIWVNPAFTTITGYTASEAFRQNLRILNSGKHPKAFFHTMWQTILAGQVWQGEIINRHKDGSLYTEDQTITPVRDDRGEISHFIAIKQDITENKKLTQQLSQAQKMESIGRLAGGVAHDFNNLLSVIIGYSEILLEGPGPDDKTRKHVEEIQKAGHRAASLTRQLLAFSRQQVLEPRILNLNTCVAEIEKMLRRLIGEDIELRTSLDSTLGPVKADPGQIEQVIMNLAVNARDAMPQGGTLVIETSNADLGDEYSLQHPPLAAGRYVLLAVTDSGVGMSPETKARIFEPFFTTKELGKGTGLGLSTVYGVVKQSGGFIWVYSEPGQGSAFKIYLPRTDGAERQTRQAESAPGLLRGTETVLLVEDEQAVRTLTRNLLEQGGYKVLEADNGARAIEIAGQHHGPIHLLLTDVVMPGMNGPALADKVLPIHPEAKALYVSGYSGSYGTHTGLVPVGANLLHKPFSRATLLQKLRDVLDLQHDPKS
jgi:two-component system, cell cycle sensor histidine kinase and response regulator CckA